MKMKGGSKWKLSSQNSDFSAHSHILGNTQEAVV